MAAIPTKEAPAAQPTARSRNAAGARLGSGITTGPYRYVRHPAYTCCPFLMIGGGLALGSWLAAQIGLLLVLPVLRRTALEDRMLRERLEGTPPMPRRCATECCPGVRRLPALAPIVQPKGCGMIDRVLRGSAR